MIAVTLNGVAPDDWYDDNRVLLDYAFEQKALRSQQGTLGTGEFVTYRDPDAAKILAMASASAAIVVPGTPAEPLTNTVTVAEPQAPAVADVAQQPAAAPDPAPVAVLTAPGVPGVSSGAFLAAAAVGIALIALQGLAAWKGSGRGPGGYTPREFIGDRSLVSSE